MKQFIRIATLALAGLGLSTAARASIDYYQIEFQYSDPAGNLAIGVLQADLIAQNEYHAKSGTLTVTSTDPSAPYAHLYSYFDNGLGSLLVDPVLLLTLIYDNQINRNVNPFLTYNGLLFKNDEYYANIYGIGPDYYGFYVTTVGATGQPNDQWASYAGQAVITGFTVVEKLDPPPKTFKPTLDEEIAAVPEPSAALAGALLLVPALAGAFGAWRRPS